MSDGIDQVLEVVDTMIRTWRLNGVDGDCVCLARGKDYKIQPNGKGKHETWHNDLIILGPSTKTKVLQWLAQNTPEIWDLYWSPLVYTGSFGKENAKASCFAWGDIDNGKMEIVPPSVYWETSKGRFAGLWMLDKTYPASEAAQISKEIAYGIGADHGGWDLVQVLRIPRTKHHKDPNNVQTVGDFKWNN